MQDNEFIFIINDQSIKISGKSYGLADLDVSSYVCNWPHAIVYHMRHRWRHFLSHLSNAYEIRDNRQW